MVPFFSTPGTVYQTGVVKSPTDAINKWLNVIHV